MAQLNLESGQEIYIGRPAVLLPAAVTTRIAEIVGEFNEVLEAHLPQIFVPGVYSQARQILVIVTDSAPAGFMNELVQLMGQNFSPHFSIDIWPIALNHPVLSSVRAAEMRIK